MTARSWRSGDPERPRRWDARRRALAELEWMIPPEVRRDIAIRRVREARRRLS